MAYIGQGIKQGTFKVLDTSGNTYNGSNTTFSLGTQVGAAAQLLVSHDGVIQKPGTDYTLASGGASITFSTAPASGASIFITEISGAVGGTVTPSDASVTTDKLAATSVTTAKLGADAVTEAKIADDAVESEHLNNNIISGQTALGATPADTDEFLVSDAGTIKRVDYSYIKGSSTIGGLTDVTMDATNFSSGLLIQPNSSGSAPTTGTLNSASFNIGIGKDVFKALTEGDDNVAIGTNAGQALTTGSDNLFVGRDCGYGITTGEKNVCIGATSMGNNDTESHNLAIGFSTLNAAINGGEQNTAIGNYSGDAITSADGNTVVGYNVGSALTAGGSNVMIGQATGNSCDNGATNIIIGALSDTSAGNANEQIVIGYNQTAVGDNIFSLGVGNTNRVYNNFGSNASWTRSSDERLKKDIKTNEDCGLDFINDLRTVTFKWKAPSEQPKEFTSHDPEKTEPSHKDKLYGFIAQEVKSVLDKHNITDFNGWNSAPDGDNNSIESISYEMFVIPLVKSIQELSKKVEDLEKKLEDK